MNKDQLISDFVSKQLNHNLKKWFIMQLTDTEYCLFNEYHILKEGDRFKVIHLNNSIVREFYSLKHAVTYCICEKLKKYYDSERIINLDRRIQHCMSNELLHKKLLVSTKDNMKKDLYLTKYNEDLYQKKLAQERMNYYAVMSKRWLNEKLDSLIK